MKKTRIAIMLLSLSLLMAAAPVTSTAATSTVKAVSLNIKMNFDDKALGLPEGQYTFIHNGTTYVPVRFISNALKKNVQWNGQSKSVTISEPDSSQMVSINESIMNSSSISNNNFSQKTIILTPIEVSYIYNDGTTASKVKKASFMLNNSLYVPLRFISELTGNEILWDQKGYVISALSKSYKESLDQSKNSNSNGDDVSSGNEGASNTGSNVQNPSGGGTNSSNYNNIVSITNTQLNSLYEQSKASLLSLALKYYATESSSEKAQLKSEGQALLSQLTAQFEAIINSAESQLKQGGFSTDIINEYRDKFNAEIEAGKKLADELS